jgi:hypothetical protein
MKKLFQSLVLLGVLVAPPAFAQGTPQQVAACKDDAYKFCPWDVPDPVTTEQCMLKYFKALSPACQAQFNVGKNQARR